MIDFLSMDYSYELYYCNGFYSIVGLGEISLCRCVELSNIEFSSSIYCPSGKISLLLSFKFVLR